MSQVTHSFSVDVANAVGDRKAIMLNNFAHWHKINMTDERHCMDGHVWLYNTVEDFARLWTYLTPKQIRTSLDSLEEDGYLITGNYNEFKNDRKKWYALTQKACDLLCIEFSHLPKRANAFAQMVNSILLNGQMQLPKRANPIAQMGKSYTNTKPIETSIKISIGNTTAANATATPYWSVLTISLAQYEVLLKSKKKKAPPGSATPPPSNHLFRNSPYAERTAFVAAFTSDERYCIYDADWYYDLVSNWAASKGAVKKDWLATARNFMLSDAQKNQARLRPDLQPQQSQSNGYAAKAGRNATPGNQTQQQRAEFAHDVYSAIDQMVATG
ncbi:hypothetical protein [Fibrella forsythiae]|uniref:Uncharacterized protein n=1 Tax=Fibrella forsythiae TaxID=2817061 RepID=A0ABS3JC50_9BACT|nr:hypothetical protein [Fibrella forsythiae]MBO0947557.1 hypothetical protein [Fibrella forsythiae]